MAISPRRTPLLLTSPDIAAPALMGFFRPRILLPRHVLDSFSREELRLILLHELAHLRRRDIPVNWLLAILQVAHWFNPVLWWAFARIRADRELACDELVLAASHPSGGDLRHAYGQTVIRLLEILSRGTVLPGMVGILETGHLSMKRRITMIASYNSRRRGTLWAAFAVLALAAVALTGPVRGQDKTGDPAGPKPRATGELGPAGAADGNPRIAKPSPRRAPVNEEEARRNARTQEQLARPLPEVKFDGVPLADALEFLRDATGVNVFVNWRELEALGIDRTVPVTIRLREVPASDALRLILNSISREIDSTVEGGVLIIAPGGGIPSRADLVTRAYDVRDLIDQGPLPATRPAFGGGFAGGADTPLDPHSAKMQQLIDIIKETVAPDSWRDNGGDEGAIKWFNHKLLISATESRHREVEKLLAMLRDDGGPAAGPATGDPRRL